MVHFICVCLILCLELLHAGTSSVPKTSYVYNRETGVWLSQHNDPATWVEAKKQCQKEGGELLAPTSMMRSVMMAEKSMMRSVFFGLRSFISRKSLKVQGGLPLSEMPLCWVSAPQTDEGCITMTGAGGLAAVSCTGKLPYFCHQSNKTLERNKCGANNYTLELRTGKCYKLHRARATWNSAHLACKKEGAELAVIKSAEEADILKRMLRRKLSRKRQQAIIGIRKRNGKWMTVDNKTLKDVGFDAWSPGEPSIKHATDACGFFTKTGLLNDETCDKTAPFICEIRAKDDINYVVVTV